MKLIQDYKKIDKKHFRQKQDLLIGIIAHINDSFKMIHETFNKISINMLL